MGSNIYGQLGIPKTHQNLNISTPKLVEELKNEMIYKIEAGSHHSLAINSKGEAFTWGRGDQGQLGHGDFRDDFFPNKVKFLENESKIGNNFGKYGGVLEASCGNNHTGFVMKNGCVCVVGDNSFGQLGLSDLNQCSRPVMNSFIKEKIKDISCGNNFTLFLKSKF